MVLAKFHIAIAFKLTMLIDKTKQTIAKFKMLEKGDRVLVAVSGGPDSMALLHILNSLRKEYDINLYVAHLNHMIRKGAAEKDAMFVGRAAKKMGIPAIIESQNVPRLAKERKLSIEEAARMARYDLYLEAAKEFTANKIALAHTGDDQAETVLMRLIRGAGLLGLAGIPAKRNLSGATIIRPLIEISRREIEQYLKTHKISFRQDKTNFDTKYFRNRIRHRLLPFLEKEFSGEIKKTLRETAENIRIDYDYLAKISDLKFKKYLKCMEGSSVKISLRFLKEETAIQRLILRKAIKEVKGNLDAVSYSHMKDLLGLLNKKTAWSFDLPGGIAVKRQGDYLVFCKKGRSLDKNDFSDISCSLTIPGVTRLDSVGKMIDASFVKRPVRFTAKRTKQQEYFDFMKLEKPIIARFKRPKDKIRPLGMAGYKKIKQLLSDEKVPPEERGEVPLIVSGKEIIWVCGVKRSDFARIDNGTKRILKLAIR